MVKISTGLAHRAKMSCSTIVGIINWDENLEALIEISDVKLKQLLNSDSTIKVVEEQNNITGTKPPADTKPPVIEEKTTQLIGVHTTALMNALQLEIAKIPPAEMTEEKMKEIATVEMNKLTVKVLHEICEEKKAPESEWKSLLKDDLIKYLLSK
jgi:hypothetical protein